MNTEKTVSIYQNLDAAKFELNQLEITLTEAKAVKNYLIEKDVLCTPEAIKAACSRNFDSVIEHFIQSEKAKLTAFEKQFGVIALLTGNTEERLKESADKLRADLMAGMPKISYLSMYYFDMIDFDTLEISPEYNKKYFEQKNSIQVAPEAAKHQKNLVDALNYFATVSDLDLNVLFRRLVNVKGFEREYSANLEFFDFNKEIRNFVENKIQEVNRYGNR